MPLSCKGLFSGNPRRAARFQCRLNLSQTNETPRHLNVFTHSVRTSQESRYVSVTNKRLMLLKEIPLFAVRIIRNT
jgi:hypothetical protein